MLESLTPARQRGVEILDDPATPIDVRQRAMADLVRSNALLGGTRAALLALRGVMTALPRQAVLLDVGTGLADIPSRAVLEATRHGKLLTTIGVDKAGSLFGTAQARLSGGGIVANALRLPLADGSADVVMCSQLLHHFEDGDALRVIAELHRVSRGWVIVCDLRRSWFAATGYLLASRALAFHDVTRRDGYASVLRGFTPDELHALVGRAVGAKPVLQLGAFWRVSATWQKQ